ncbi:FAD-dependent oxidoreductase [Micromonospora sp. NBC_01796]|uniref:FAD-dependent oxidoreductase n=1 Tax=Micromonospora sp. NBC_01796 TaxID=2975987 RepID=UPI002DD7D434|nr:FAD-dependent oxidoreductase [Micromonospora sp. NBC_01796]WSA88224.1 FAD-binding oxidoreductase [Micromonospora sp. NBC_01796]
MAPANIDVLVVGAGVTGLTTAVCLAESGRSVLVRTRDRPADTTSFAAGAIWGRVIAAHERAAHWGQQTLSLLKPLARAAGTGVRLVTGLEATRVPCPPHPWLTGIDDFEVCPPAELPAGFVAGWRYTAPVVDMPRYLEYLVNRLGRAGGRIERATVGSLAEVAAEAPVVVNCTGAAARELVPDNEVQPTRGQLVVVDNPGVHWFFAESDTETTELTYFLPHGDHVVLGGTMEVGHSDAAPQAETAAAIVRRCAAVEPALGRARILDHRVGFRPVRPQVRLEQLDLDGGIMIHNYGHGGSGISLSWGCALEVLNMIETRTATPS